MSCIVSNDHAWWLSCKPVPEAWGPQSSNTTPACCKLCQVTSVTGSVSLLLPHFESSEEGEGNPIIHSRSQDTEDWKTVLLLMTTGAKQVLLKPPGTYDHSPGCLSSLWFHTFLLGRNSQTHPPRMSINKSFKQGDPRDTVLSLAFFYQVDDGMLMHQHTESLHFFFFSKGLHTPTLGGRHNCSITHNTQTSISDFCHYEQGDRERVTCTGLSISRECAPSGGDTRSTFCIFDGFFLKALRKSLSQVISRPRA